VMGLQRAGNREIAVHGDISRHSRGCTSVPSNSDARSLQDVSNQVLEAPEIPLMDGWTMPKGKQPQLILTEAAVLIL
jgi:hypothetical protein